MNTLTRIHVQGYRSLRDVTLEFGRVNVLIGANGSGKSNLLSVIRLLSAIRTRSLRRHVAVEGGASTLLFRGDPPAEKIGLLVEFATGGQGAAYGFTLGAAAGDQLLFEDEHVSERAGPAERWEPTTLGAGYPESRLPDAPGAGPAYRAFQNLGSFGYFHFHDTTPNSALRSNARAIDHRRLAPDGGNLAAYLLFLKQSTEPGARAAWTFFHDLVRQVAPFIKELDPVPVNADPATFRLDDPAGRIDHVTIRLDWIDESGARFAMHQLSDGTLRLIALFAALTQPGSSLPPFLVIDEPELGLHPAALHLLVELIRSVSYRCQVLLATQSNALMDHFTPDEVVVAERVGGATELRRLDASALSAWLEDYSLGQLFDMNLLGGRP